MKSTVDSFVGQRLAKWVSFIQAKPNAVLSALSLITLLLAVVAVFNLGINSNNLDLLSPKIESRINQAEFSKLFPDIENALLVIVDGPSPELTRTAAKKLSKGLRKSPETISSAHIPGGGEFFEDNALLYLDQDQLRSFTQQLSKLRPFVISLEANPNLLGFSELIIKNMRVTRFSFDYEQTWEPMLDRFLEATEIALEGANSNAKAIGSVHESFFTGVAEFSDSKRQVIVVNPVLEFGSILAANRAIKSVRASAEENGLTIENGFNVSITGNPALNLEEMIGIAWDIGVAGIFCFLLVIVVLTFALRSFPLVVASVATLLVGLIWTAGAASLIVGHLNIVSLSVAILFIGLGVDFAIHLGMSYADALHRGLNELSAMQESIGKIGSSLFICTISTAIGFLVFVPTAYLGVAELGLIAGTGMVVIFFLTVTLFPALLISWLRFDAEKHIKHGLRFEADLGDWVRGHSRAVLCVAFVLLIAGLVIAPNAQFDPNVIDMRDPSTESVQAFNQLLDESGLASPWYIDAVAKNISTAQALAKQTSELDTVKQTITILDYVPSDQREKIAALNDLSEQFTPLAAKATYKEPTTAEKIHALNKLNIHLNTDSAKSDTDAFSEKELRLAQQLNLVIDTADSNKEPSTINALEKTLVGDLPNQVATLRATLDAKEITLGSLPQALTRRMVAADGQARVQIYPQENLRDQSHLREFVSSVQAIAPKATGMAVNLVAFENATKQSFKQALASAFLLIAILLIYLWRNTTDVLLVLSPLVLSLVLAVASMTLLGLSFNFTNVIVIPLMFGIGVDSGIHLVHRSHGKEPKDLNLLNTTTARAVFYSALTTFISFGSLSLSSHQGMSSLGTLLAIGMVLTVMCNLIVLPALLDLQRSNWKLRA